MALVTSQRIAKNPFNVKTSDILSSYQEIPGNLNILETLGSIQDFAAHSTLLLLLKYVIIKYYNLDLEFLLPLFW